MPLSIGEQLNILNDRMNNIIQMMAFLEEYDMHGKTVLVGSDYARYFETIYSYIGRYVVLEFYRMNETKSKSDCISITQLKKDAIINFERCFPFSNDDIFHHPYCNITLEEMKAAFVRIYSRDTKAIQEKINIIRNKEGLAHRQVECYYTIVSLDELKALSQAYMETLWIIDERLNNTHYAFGSGIIKYKGLSELVAELQGAQRESEVD